MSTNQKITDFCKDNGFTPFRPSNEHNCGVPRDFAVRLDTERKLVDGYHALFVFSDRVELRSLRYPTSYNDWQLHTSRAYGTTGELLTILRELAKAPEAVCWA